VKRLTLLLSSMLVVFVVSAQSGSAALQGQLPPCPSAAFTIVDVSNQGGSPIMTLDVGTAGFVESRGNDGSSGGASPQGAGRISFQVGTAETKNKLQQGQSVTVTYTVTLTGQDPSGARCTRADGTQGFGNTETRMTTVTLQPNSAPAGTGQPAGSGTGPPAGSGKLAVRYAGVNVLFPGRPTLISVIPVCVFEGQNSGPADCVNAATATITVSAATKRKLKLRTAILARGDEVVPCGQAECLRLKASKAVRERLKKAKRVAVTFRLQITSPVKETLTKKLTMEITRTDDAERLLLRSSGDTFVFSGGRG